MNCKTKATHNSFYLILKKLITQHQMLTVLIKLDVFSRQKKRESERKEEIQISIYDTKACGYF